ncbi:MAG: AcrR family transcriptional regulator [Polaribacter sp.]|jgi:AcrR family transcriptional regulator|uniref:TetR/AcrR family transcriptional regulator n=1 Tax=Psychroserpens sp. TaxID=2020870 RepID=UPI0039E28651
MNKTKKKILNTAVILYNESGIANVRNQDIAERAGMSLSNFNYHFGAKKDLIVAVFDLMFETLQKNVYGNSILVKEGQGLTITKSYFEFQERFCFFYLDTPNILKMFPDLNEKVQKQIEESYQIIKNLNYLAIGMGMMKPEPEDNPGSYDQLMRHIWIHNHFWFANSRIINSEDNLVKKGIESLFNLCYPYLTKKGVLSYKQFIKLL